QVSTYRGNGRRATTTESTGVENEHVHKRREGGLAHMQYQRSAEEGWRDRAREGAELAEKHPGYELVVVAGSIESRKEVVENLAGGQAEVIELERSARNPDRSDQDMDDDIDAAVYSYLQERRCVDDAGTRTPRPGTIRNERHRRRRWSAHARPGGNAIAGLAPCPRTFRP